MNPTQSILMLDIRGILRDNVMIANVALSFVGMIIITIVGYFQHDNPAAVAWFPFLIIMALMSNPAPYGFLFGLLMVDERDTGVRKALAVSPIKPTYLLFIRTVLSVSLMIVWPIITVLVMNSTWNALPISYTHIFIIGTVLSVIAPIMTLSIASYANNKVEALALFKGLNFILIAPLALEFVPADAVYRYILLASPTAWSFMAFQSFSNQILNEGYMWAAGGLVYSLLLYAMVMRYYLKDTYKS